MAATRIYLVLTAVAAAVALVVGTAATLQGAAAMVVDDAAKLAGGVAAMICCWWTGRRASGVERIWRLCLAIGFAGWSGGQVIWSWYQIFGDRALPSPSLADLGYLLLPVFALAGLLAIARDGLASSPRASRRSLFVLVLDGLVVVGSLFILTWSTALGAVVRAGAPTPLAFGTAIAYPLTDLILVVIVVLLAASPRVARKYRPQLLILGLGLVALSISDSIFAYLVSVGAEEMSPIADAGFVAGPALIAVAVFVPVRSLASVAERPRLAPEWIHLLLPYAPLAATGVLIAGQTATGAGPGRVEMYVGLLVVALVVTRQLITRLENRALLDRVSEGQERLAYQAFHDPLTGLANRALFRDRLARAVADRRPLALLFLDLDDFKLINDSLGHAAGDAVLHAVGERLTANVRRTDTVGRLGGDEFGVLVDGGAEPPQSAGERLLRALCPPFAVGDRTVTVGASMGIVVADSREPGLTADALLRRVDAAMYDGKRRGKGTLAVYRPGVAATLGNPDLPTMLAEALRGGLVDVHYQPIVRMVDGATAAVEALARWAHPVLGDVPADVFVPAAERAGLVAELDDLVLERACRDVAGLGVPLDVHVNVSAGRLGCPYLEATVIETLDRYGLPGNRLVLEITETSRIPDLGAAAAMTGRLREFGVRLALDDFGTGYNTLAHLHLLPVDVVKLDQALTGTGTDARRTEALGRSVVSISRALGMTVIAEGVETRAQARTVAAWGCNLGQGYLYGRSVPIADLAPVGV